MSRNIPEKVIDITGVELTPGKPAVCLGNGEPISDSVPFLIAYYCARVSNPSAFSEGETPNIFLYCL